ncbi:MAG: IS1634 family transposase [Thermoleophilia bacterium]|nr:IS1634 family transposase [Thermoleophilia bacterium]
MYLRSTAQKRKDGSVIRYLQLAQNVWDPVKKRSRAEIVYSFGREDAANRAALERLVSSVSRFLSPEAALSASSGEDFAFMESRPLGGAYVLDALWQRLGIDATLRRLLRGRRLDPRAERVLFSLVANRALSPSSKLAASRWVTEDAEIQGLPETTDDQCYRAMDFLLEIAPALEREVFHQVATLLNLEVDLLFFDTTSTYFCRDEADAPVARDGRGRRHAASVDADTDDLGTSAGFRTYGKSKDHRDDLPQIVIGMAVTREGIPVRVWSWPGNTADSSLIREVKEDLRDWALARIVWVADRGFSSAENRRYLRRGDHHYIIGERLRSGSAMATAALSRAGRYQEVAENLKVKEVKIAEGERFVICFNPEAAERDAAVRTRLVARLQEMIADSDKLSPSKRAELRGVISTKPGLHRFLRVTAGGLLRLDAQAITAEEKLDGKYLLRSSDPSLSAEDIALGYKQLLEVERGWRDMKHVLDLRPVYHRKEERIRAHVLLCWLALLLIRVAETSCTDTWLNLRRELQRLQVGTFQGPAGTSRRRTQITRAQRTILGALKLSEPPEIQELAAAAQAS